MAWRWNFLLDGVRVWLGDGHFGAKKGLAAFIMVLIRALWGHFDAKKGLDAIFYEKLLSLCMVRLRMRSRPPPSIV